VLDPNVVLAGARTTVSFQPASMVRELMAYGEFEAAEQIMQLDSQAIAAIGVLASQHYSTPSSPMLDTAICMGVVEFLEEKSRPLKRRRRSYREWERMNAV
jgi:hypothetical protein